MSPVQYPVCDPVKSPVSYKLTDVFRLLTLRSILDQLNMVCELLPSDNSPTNPASVTDLNF